MKPLHLVFSLLLTADITFAQDTFAREVEIVTEDSIFAVITHKGGFASGVAHNHLITATGYQADLSFDAEAPRATRFEIELASEQLKVDPWDLEQKWYPRFEELELLDEPFSEVSDKDRSKIRKSMLSKGQLDAAASPRITAKVTAVREQATTLGDVAFPYAADLELEIRGKTVKKPVAARYQLDGETLTIEAVGAFLFTDFGIKPYSALLGAVKNEDEFHVYVSLRALAR